MTTDLVGGVDPDRGAYGPPERARRRRAEDVIAAVYADAERVKRRELAEAVGRIEAHGDLTDEQRDAVEALADALVDRLLAAPIRRLRRAPDPAAIDTAVRLFDPDLAGETTTAPDESAATEVDDDD